MSNLHAKNSKKLGQRNWVRLLVVGSCVATPMSFSLALAQEVKQPSVGITFKTEKQKLPAATAIPSVSGPALASAVAPASSDAIPMPAPKQNSELPGLPPLELGAPALPPPNLPNSAEQSPAALPGLDLPVQSNLPSPRSLETAAPPKVSAPTASNNEAGAQNTSVPVGTGLLPPPPLPASLTQSAPTKPAISATEPVKIGLSDTGNLPVELPSTAQQAAQKVVVKFGDSGAEKASLSDSTSNATGMKPSASQNTKPTVRLTDAPATVGSGLAASAPTKYSLDDNGVIEHTVKAPSSAPLLQQRAPELIKPGRQSSAKVVALPETKDPAHLSAVVENKADAAIVSAPNLPTNGQEIVVPPQMNMAVHDGSVRSARLSIPAPAMNIAVPQAKMVGYQTNSHSNANSDLAADRIYELEVLGTCSVVLPATITSASAKNSNVCNVFHNGPTLTVVGSSAGKTSIEVITENGHRRMLTFKVSASGSERAGQSKDVERVMAMIRQHFPTASVDFVQEPTGGLTLKGLAQTETDARKILELVRKVCLVPVDDKIQVLR